MLRSRVGVILSMSKPTAIEIEWALDTYKNEMDLPQAKREEAIILFCKLQNIFQEQIEKKYPPSEWKHRTVDRYQPAYS